MLLSLYLAFSRSSLTARPRKKSTSFLANADLACSAFSPLSLVQQGKFIKQIL